MKSDGVGAVLGGLALAVALAALWFSWSSRDNGRYQFHVSDQGLIVYRMDRLTGGISLVTKDQTLSWGSENKSEAR